MKKNVMMRMASCLLVAVLLTTCVISGTFAKYTSEYTGTDSARVAKWDVTFNGAEDGTTNTTAFDLFATTVKDTEDSPDETDVKNGTETEAIVAPGTWGYFDIVLTNESEVNATYTLTLKETFSTTLTDATSPIVYAIGTNTQSISDVTMTNAGTNGTITINKDNVSINMTNGTETIRVFWMWAFDDATNSGANDTSDTALGLDGASTITVEAKVVFTQVD